jgi:superfamily II RNA helicase
MRNNKTHHRRPSGKFQRKETRRSRKSPYENCRLDPALKNLFKQIGVPETTPFKPDPFQTEALEKIGDHDVLVSAPTGSGKTWIAMRAIEQNLSKGLRTWYASPLKALSNSLYQVFSLEFGKASCGILTGERKENAEAPVIVGTTEILRNQLYDAMHEGTSIEADLVILDEAHYLSDPDRGVVWEEVLIYLPSRVRLLLLSATISNAEEVCSWLIRNRKTRIHVVRSHERVVPLETLFLFPDGLIAPLGGRKGLTSRVNKFLSSYRVDGKTRGRGKPRFGDILSCLRQHNLLPAIFFLKSRMDCDRALEWCPYVDTQNEIRNIIKKEVAEFLDDYPHLKAHRHLTPMLDSLVASHHAGQLPYWKILIEKMMQKGYLDAIFSTSTVAAGVNFPARTVALVQSDRFNGHEFADLTSTDLHQMTGRAGRRGMDNIGFALIIPGLHQDPKLIYELMDSPPEPLISQIHINFSMTLNLLLSHTPLEIKTLLDLSFANFQHGNTGSSFQKRWGKVLATLKGTIPNSNCDSSDPFEVMEFINERSELKKQQKNLNRAIRDKGRQEESGKAEEIKTINEKMKSLPCEGCEVLKKCDMRRNRDLRMALHESRSLAGQMGGMSETLWISFKKHLRFLKETGFVDESDRLSPDGIWASKLRLDQPLLIAEAIRKDGFKDLTPEVIAGCIALFVWDRDQDVEMRPERQEDLTVIEVAFQRLIKIMEDIRALKVRRGFETPLIPQWPAMALFLWAKGMQWEQLISYFAVGEGDLASMIMRTADHLRQVANLRETHPELADVSEKAISQILREPVFIP